MSTEIKSTLNEIKSLIKAWRIIEHDYSDCEQKDTAQKIIDELLIAKCEDLADWYEESKEA